MKIKQFTAILLACSMITACSKVDPGHVGIKVNNWGGDGSGVSSQPLGVGYYYAGPGTEIYEYPVFTSTYTWTADPNEQTPIDESFHFQDENGVSLSADVSIAYHVNADQAPILFQKYRTDMNGIVEGPMRNAVRSALIEDASTMPVDVIYGSGKTKLINDVQKEVQEYFAPFGLVIDQVYWASGINVPQSILNQINQKTANEQEALAAQANVATATAKADAAVATAEGEAKAIQIESAAIASNPQILEYTAIQKWNGVLPQVTSGATPIIDLGNNPSK